MCILPTKFFERGKVMLCSVSIARLVYHGNRICRGGSAKATFIDELRICVSLCLRPIAKSMRPPIELWIICVLDGWHLNSFTLFSSRRSFFWFRYGRIGNLLASFPISTHQLVSTAATLKRDRWRSKCKWTNSEVFTKRVLSSAKLNLILVLTGNSGW